MDDKLFTRDWLNEDEGSAYIFVQAERYSKGSRYHNGDIEFKDCNRQIQLDFGYSDEEQRQQRLTKIDLIIDRLNALRAWIVAHDDFTVEKNEKKEEDGIIITAPGLE